MEAPEAGWRAQVAGLDRLARTWVATLLVVLAPLLSACARDAAVPVLRLEEDLVLGLDPGVPLGAVSDIAVDSQGNILVLDRGFQVVRKFNPNGTHLGDLCRAGEGPGEFREPTCLAADPGDRIYIAGPSPEVVVLAPDGAPMTSFRRQCPNVARGIAVDDAGNVFVCCGDYLSHVMIDTYAAGTHAYVTSFCDTYASEGGATPMTERTFAVGYLDLGSNGRLYYVQWALQVVRVFDLDGGLVAEHPARFDETVPPSEPEPRGGGMVYRTPDANSGGILALSGGRYLVSLHRRAEDGPASMTLDLRDADGRLLASLHSDRGFAMKARDAEGRILVSETRDVPAVVRYRIVSPRP